MSNTTEADSTSRSRRIKFWGVAIVLLMMVLMIFSANPLSGRSGLSGGSSVTVGTTRDGTRVTADDRTHAVRLIEALETIGIDPGNGEPVPMLPLCWGDDVLGAFRREPEALHLALVASRRSGPGTSPLTLGPMNPDDRSEMDMGIFNSGMIWLDQLYPLPASQLGQVLINQPRLRQGRIVTNIRGGRSFVPIASLSTAEQRILYDALNDFLTLQSAASVTNSAIKVSRPIIDRNVSERMQRMTVRVAAFDASTNLASVPEPTDAQLAAHFAKYAAAESGVATKGNPFGFGYRVADRVKLEWIVIDRAAVREAVRGERSPYDWEVETRVAFAKDPTALTPATQSTTRPTFEEVRDDAVKRHIDAATDARIAEIERRVRAQMTSDFQSWTAARTTNATTLPTSVGVPIESGDYLDRIAANVEKQFKVKPTVERLSDAWRDATQLSAASPSFATFSRIGNMMNRVTLQPIFETAPTYAARAASTRPVNRRDGDPEAAIAPFQPSQTLSDDANAKRMVFRVVAADPAHPAQDLTSVRDRVVADWKIEQAQALALKKARDASDALRTSPASDAGLTWKTVTISQIDAVAAALEITPDAALQLREAANDVLLGEAATAKPTAALDVPLARRAYVGQRLKLEPEWTSAAELAELRERGRAVLPTAMGEPMSSANAFGLTSSSIGGSWLDVKQIYERAGWTPSR